MVWEVGFNAEVGLHAFFDYFVVGFVVWVIDGCVVCVKDQSIDLDYLRLGEYCNWVGEVGWERRMR